MSVYRVFINDYRSDENLEILEFRIPCFTRRQFKIIVESLRAHICGDHEHLWAEVFKLDERHNNFFFEFAAFIDSKEYCDPYYHIRVTEAIAHANSYLDLRSYNLAE